MNQLYGKYVNVVLSIECGKGMDFIKNPVHITGNFNGRILESDSVNPAESPLFNTELIWEIEKKELRKIRSANQPLRVECISTDQHNRKERIGFTLMSLRSAQIIPQKNANKEVNFVWHKLIGCQTDKKKSHPELYLSLALRDHLLNECEASNNSLNNMPYISEEDTSHLEEYTKQYPIQYFENGHIQIGSDDEATKIFHFNIFVKEVMNLDTLLPEILVFNENKEKYYLTFKILGVNIKTKPFRKELHNNIQLNEKIVVILLSNKELLEKFLQNQNISISFFYGQDKLGVTAFMLNDIFNENNSTCYFKFPSPNGIVPYDSCSQSPCIEIKTWIYEKSENQLCKDISDKPKTKSVFSNVARKPSSSGDQGRGNYILDNLEKVNIKALSDNENTDQVMKPFVTKSVDTIIKNNIPLSPKVMGPFDTYQKYVIQVSLKKFLWKQLINNNKIMFKFLHPRAASCISIFTEIKNSLDPIPLNNLDIKIGYISTCEKINKLLTAWSPKLLLTDDREYRLCDEYKLNVNCIQNTIDYDIMLNTINTNEPFAEIQVEVSVKQLDLDDVDEYEHLYLLPVVLDEIITVREVSDLDKWKDQEKKIFENSLEIIKSQEVKKLEAQWDDKKSQLEERLNKAIFKCKKLQEDLKNKANTLKTDKCLRRKQNSSKLFEEFFKDNWGLYSNNNTKELIEALSKAQRDNYLLKLMVDEQREKSEEIEKSTLTKTQTANLLKELRILEEKFQEAQAAKSYFKAQWKKACEEIHELKTEDIKSLQAQIKQSKEELFQLNLDTIAEYDNGFTDFSA